MLGDMGRSSVFAELDLVPGTTVSSLLHDKGTQQIELKPFTEPLLCARYRLQTSSHFLSHLSSVVVSPF